MRALKYIPVESHVVDILGSTKGRDQPVMLLDKALQLVSAINEKDAIDERVVFFDPFCKAGEILLAIAMNVCRSSHQNKKRLVLLNDVFTEIYQSNRYFALAPDQRHYLLSMRTFYGNENSHNKNLIKHIKNGNYLSEIDGRLNEEKFKQEFQAMIEYIKTTSQCRKIIAVGNPPYQEADGGSFASAKPIYNFFVEALISSKEITEFVLVIPARWFAGGKGLDNFRDQMMKSMNIKSITHFKKSGEVFPTVDIDGGVCFLHWQQSYRGKPLFKSDEIEKQLDLNSFDIIPDDPRSYSIIEKVRKKWKGKYVSEVAWSSKPFGLRTDHFKKHKAVEKSNPDAVPCLGRERTLKYVLKSQITKKAEFIDFWKVCIPGAYGGKKGNRRMTLPVNQIFLVPKGTIVTETYMVIDVFKTKKEAEMLIQYLQTDFARYLLGLRKITQHIPKERWNWVPLVDISKNWSDEALFNYFDLSPAERKHIFAMIKEWS